MLRKSQRSDHQLQNLFNHFVELRQTNHTPEEAWQTVREESDDLAHGAKQQLAKMIQMWEARFGESYRPSERKDPHETLLVRSALKERRERDQSNTHAHSASPSPISALIPGRQQPATPTPASLISSLIPGRAIADDGKTRPLADTDHLPDHTAQLGQEGTLLIYGDKEIDPLQLHVYDNQELLIGRASPDNVVVPDIDLTRLCRKPHGVSRLHAAICRSGETLMIVDLGSKNSTFINGQRMVEHEVRLLHDGDMLRFGEVSVRVEFRAAH